MAQQTINVGAAPNDGTGDPARTAFTKCNANFIELYTADTTFLTAATSGNRVLIQSQTVGSAVATVDFTTGIDSTFDQYEIAVYNYRPATNNSALSIRVSQDAGGTWKAGASDYQSGYFTMATTSSIATRTRIELQNMDAANASTSSGNAIIRFAVPATAGVHKSFYGMMGYPESVTPTQQMIIFAGSYRGNTNAINGVRFLASSGNIATGTFALYGIVI